MLKNNIKKWSSKKDKIFTFIVLFPTIMKQSRFIVSRSGAQNGLTLFLIKVAISVLHFSFLRKLSCVMGHWVPRSRTVQHASITKQFTVLPKRLQISISSSVLSSQKAMWKWLCCILLLQLCWKASSQPVKTALDTPFNDEIFAGLRHWVEDYYGMYV